MSTVSDIETSIKRMQEQLASKKETMVMKIQHEYPIVYVIKVKYRNYEGKDRSYIYAYCSSYDKVKELWSKYCGHQPASHRVEVWETNDLAYDILSQLDQPIHGIGGYVSD